MALSSSQQPSGSEPGASGAGLVAAPPRPAEEEGPPRAVQERALDAVEATWLAMRQHVEAALKALGSRVAQAREGKGLLDRGGEPAIAAKQASADAAGADAKVLQEVQAAIRLMDTAAGRLRDPTMAGPQVQGITGTETFTELAQGFETRARVYRQVANLLQQPTAPPAASPVEEDAMLILQVKRGGQSWCSKAGAECTSATHSIVDGSKRALRSACA